jgi:hypothetical protein
MRHLTIVLLLLTGCAAQKEINWVRGDGKPFDRAQFNLDQLACKGETQKAALTTTQEARIACGSEGCYSTRAKAVNDVFVGCMAQHGYLGQ